MDTLRDARSEHTDLAASLAAQGVEFALGAWSDVNGRPKSKVVPIALLPTMLAGSERYTPRGMGDLGQMNPNEDECVALPDPATLRVLPWDRRVAFFNADLLYGGREPFANCPRSILKRVVRQAADQGYTFSLGVETEFYVYQRDRLPDLVPLAPSGALYPTPAYDVESTLGALTFLSEVATLMQASDMPLFSFDHEGGDGQYELDFSHAEALAMCDQLVYLRLLLRHAADQVGGIVTFMPKPAATAWGSGAHMNLSLESAEDGSNLFIDPTASSRTWTPLALSFVAGVLRHADALSALTCPTVNSYKRLTPTLFDGSVSWAPVWAAYGWNNRSCMLRLPDNRPAIENRSVDMTANMYLASALTLAAGLEGVAKGLEPGDAVTANTAQWNGAPSASARRLPRNMLEAIDAFQADELVHEVFPAGFVTDYVDMRQREWDAYHSHVTSWELERYLTNI